jgi:phosphatidylserine/phosphatidylglycerophosphate/cardiolipin synthase-like enzyme
VSKINSLLINFVGGVPKMLNNTTASRIVVDAHIAIMGGSNVCPTMAAATTEIDMVVYGPVVQDLYQSNLELWQAMDPTTTLEPQLRQPPATPSAALQVFVQQQEWSTAQACDAQFLRSNPSSQGEDTIRYKVLEAIAQANHSIRMCFGHSNFPQPVCQALRQATDRGVHVQVMVNSMYSCDLRGGQQDLFRSLQNLLRIAPQVQVYSTDLRRQQDND